MVERRADAVDATSSTGALGTSARWFVKLSVDGLIEKSGGNVGLHERDIPIGHHLDAVCHFLCSKDASASMQRFSNLRQLSCEKSDNERFRVRLVVPDATVLHWFALGISAHAYRAKVELLMHASKKNCSHRSDSDADVKKARTDAYVVNGIHVVAQVFSDSTLVHLADVQSGDLFVSFVHAPSSTPQVQERQDKTSLRVPRTCLGVVTLGSAPVAASPPAHV
jgi:hypothetical protein